MNHAHDATDEMADWGHQHNTPRAFIPQGCDQRGRYVPTIDRLPEAWDEDQTESADSEVARFLLWMLLGLVLVIAAIAGFCHFYKVWMAL